MGQNKSKILWAGGVRTDKQMKNTEDNHASQFEFLRCLAESVIGKQNISSLQRHISCCTLIESRDTGKSKQQQSWYILLTVCTSKPKDWRSITSKMLSQKTYSIKYHRHFNKLCTLYKLPVSIFFPSLENTYLGKVKCRSKMTNELFSISHFRTSLEWFSFSAGKWTTWKK